LDAAFPCQKSCRAEQSFADILIDRAVDHQSEKALSIIIEHASDDFCQALCDGGAEQIVDLVSCGAPLGGKDFLIADLASARGPFQHPP
jgi:hypothetical protein